MRSRARGAAIQQTDQRGCFRYFALKACHLHGNAVQRRRTPTAPPAQCRHLTRRRRSNCISIAAYNAARATAQPRILRIPCADDVAIVVSSVGRFSVVRCHTRRGESGEREAFS